jgi:hypothetical protein
MSRGSPGFTWATNAHHGDEPECLCSYLINGCAEGYARETTGYVNPFTWCESDTE